MRDKRSFSDLIHHSEIPVLVDFHAEWCGPCHALSPVIKEVASEMSGKIKVIKVDIDKNQKAAMKFQVRAVPTMVLFKQGNIVWRHSGLLTKKELKRKVEEIL